MMKFNLPFLFMRTAVEETKGKVGQRVTLFGWVQGRRNHGKIIFIDLRDRSGLVQTVFTPQHPDLYQLAEQLRPEWVVKMEGEVLLRPEKMINPEIPTGQIEIQPQAVEILAQAQTPPFALDTEGREIGEENRMAYRYLDLRRPRLKRNLELRHRLTTFIRNFLDRKGFWEVETPILTKSTPEGARDYVVPSRLYPGKFFALPQSPQQYKQLLMTAGVEKYFQIARCFRDEDTRGDRQPEFTQLDLEMSFVQREEVMDLNEELLIALVRNITPQKKIQDLPFPRLSFKEAVELYDSDRPDLRKDKNDPDLLAFCWVVDFPFFSSENGTDSGGKNTRWTFTHNPFSAPKPEHQAWVLNKERIGEIITSQYDVVLNGWEIGGGSLRAHQPEILRSVLEIIGLSPEKIEQNFGHLLKAFSYGAPPHGGIAWGLDRLISLLAGEPNIREVIAFPKTGDARDLMMDTPSILEKEQQAELHLKFN